MIAEENANRNRAKMYKCKDCNKEFDNFQSLGGHRASHRRFKRMPTTKLVMHACKICKKEFENGQSLGGHMRKHYWPKRVVNNNNDDERSVVTVATDSLASSSSSNSVSIKVVFEYDLNLTPVENEKANGGKDCCN